MFSRRDAFYIPFSVQQAANNPVDVLLFASADQGTTWKQYARQPSSEKQFLFRAGGDERVVLIDTSPDLREQALRFVDDGPTDEPGDVAGTFGFELTGVEECDHRLGADRQ